MLSAAAQLLNIWNCFHITCPIALCDMSVESPVGTAYTEIFSIIAEIQV
jgi:hypothetical protein